MNGFGKRIRTGLPVKPVTMALVVAAAGFGLTAVPAGVQAQTAAQVAVQVVQAGVAAAVRGEVRLVSFRSPEAVGANLSSGDPVYLGDKIEAGPDAGLQIMLMDETIFTIGPDSAIVIDQFVYDPEKSAGKVGARVLRGVFRFVSGRVAANKPSDMEVKLPNGVIGIRGTSAAGIVRNGQSQVVLLGPGPDNNVGEPGGRIIVSGAGSDVHITRPNFGTSLSGFAPPTPPVRWDAQKMNGITGALRAAPPRRQQEQDGQQGTGGQQAGRSAPAQGRGAEQGASGGPAAAGPVAVDGTVTKQAGQDVGAALATSGALTRIASARNSLQGTAGNLIQNIKDTLSGITTVAQFSQITNGTFNYGTVNVPFTANSSYDFSYSIDFNARTHSGSVVVNTSIADGFAANASGTFTLQHDPFSSADASLTIVEGGTGTHVPGLNSNDNQIKVEYKFVNNGSIASQIEHQVEYREPATPGTTVSASGKNLRN